jgi:hypothetical protein
MELSNSRAPGNSRARRPAAPGLAIRPIAERGMAPQWMMSTGLQAALVGFVIGMEIAGEAISF